MIAAVDVSSVVVIVGVITAAMTGVAGLITALRAVIDSHGKADEQWVGMVAKASDMLEERVTHVEQSEARCQRNVATLRAVLVNAGLPVPPLEQ